MSSNFSYRQKHTEFRPIAKHQPVRRSGSLEMLRPPPSAPVARTRPGETTLETAPTKKQTTQAWVNTTVETRGTPAENTGK